MILGCKTWDFLMYKDFDKWNELKKKVEGRVAPYAYQREIWWCYLGLNIGSEVCGKNEFFERPVLILKIFSKDNLWVIPLTSKNKNISNHIPIYVNKDNSFGMIEQIKIISGKRLTRKISKLDQATFNAVQREVFQNLFNRKPALLSG